MKNLRICSMLRVGDVDSEEPAELQGARGFCVDCLSETVYFALATSIVAVDAQGRVNVAFNVDSVEYASESLVLFEFLSDDQLLCVVLADGTVLTVNPQGENADMVALLPVDDERLLGGQWSPDMQLLVVASGSKLYTMSRDFDLVAERDLRSSQPGQDELQTIGWGSIETQFQGSAGKKNRKRLGMDEMAVAIDDRTDSGKILISWRADAQFFTVSSVDVIPNAGVRRDIETDGDAMRNEDGTKFPDENSVRCRGLRVWNRELELMSNCEFLAGTEAAMCMRPSGNLIATTQRLPGAKRTVRFFERNGQYRHSFAVGEDTTPETKAVKSLEWNSGSSILALRLSLQGKGEELQFWTTSNYDWTEKLRLSVAEQLVEAKWDPESWRHFNYLSASGQYCRVEMEFTFDCDNMLALVVNGGCHLIGNELHRERKFVANRSGRLRMTDLKRAPIPPPMSHHEFLDFEDLIEDRCGRLSLLAEHPISSHLFNLQLVDGRRASALVPRQRRCTEVAEIDLESGHMRTLSVVNELVTWHQCHPSNGRIDMITVDGKHLRANIESELPPSTVSVINSPPQACHLHEYGHMIILARSHQLFVDGRCVHQRVSSYSPSRHFLLITTLDNLLHCVPVERQLDDFLLRFQKLGKGRNVERGAQLVGHEWEGGTGVCMQLPRGNLESIHPRDLLIPRMKRLLERREFGAALVEMRRHRVNTNLLYDHSPEAFLNSTHLVVEQISDADSLNLVLSSLNDEDSTTTMFADYYPARVTVSGAGKRTAKANSVCAAIRAAILKRGRRECVQLYLAVITSFVVEKPPKVSEALVDMMEQLTSLSLVGGEKAAAEELQSRWLRHFTYLVDDKTMFNSALKTYDLRIALTVAENSDRDPKEYLPVLNDLRRKQPPLYQRYHVDLSLGEWASALEHLSQLIVESSSRANGGDNTAANVETLVGECETLIRQHKLHSRALSIFSNGQHTPVVYKRVMRLCATESQDNKAYAEAAILFRQAAEVDPALGCLLLDADHRGYIRAAERAGKCRDDICAQIKKLVPSLEAMGKLAAVAEILHYVDREANKERILGYYCKDLLWNKAVELVEESDGSLRDQLKEALASRCRDIQQQVGEWREKIVGYGRRLEAVRETKAKQLRDWPMADDPNDMGAGMSETLSQCSSRQSASSKLSKVSTSTVSRRKRQAERKKATIKEGSRYEDSALLTALRSIYVAIDKQQDELHRLLPALLCNDCVSDGRQLQSAMLSLLSIANEHLQRIWPGRWKPFDLPGPLNELYRDEDGIVRPPVEDDSMPSSLAVEDEMIAPTIRPMSGRWRLRAFAQ